MDDQGDEVGERLRRYHALHSLKATIALDVRSAAPRELDKSEFERRAFDALGSCLRHLRSVTGIIDIDVHGGAVEWEYHDQDGNALPWWSTHTLSFQGIGVLDETAWQEVVRRVRAGSPTPLESEYISEARRAMFRRDYNAAAVNAAVAAEIVMNSKLHQALQGLGGMGKETADRLAKQISKSELIDLLASFYDTADTLIDDVKESFKMRNNILHGKQRRQASEAAVRRAIKAAEQLRKAAPKQWVRTAKS